MRNILKLLLVCSALVSFDYRMALGQYLSGPSGLCRAVPYMLESGLNVVVTNGSVNFPTPVTNLNIIVSAYSSNGLDTFQLTIGIDKSMDGLVWQNAGIITTEEIGAATPGARLYSITNLNIGLFGFARCRAITNLGATALTNITVTGNTKWVDAVMFSTNVTTVATNVVNFSSTNFVGNAAGLTNYMGIKVYRALLTQSGTDAPVATVLENSLGGTLVWTRSNIGAYTGTLVGVFTTGKTFILIGSGPVNTEQNYFSATAQGGEDTVGISTSLMDFSAPSFNISDGTLNLTPIQILVYP